MDRRGRSSLLLAAGGGGVVAGRMAARRARRARRSWPGALALAAVAGLAGRGAGSYGLAWSPCCCSSLAGVPLPGVAGLGGLTAGRCSRSPAWWPRWRCRGAAGVGAARVPSRVALVYRLAAARVQAQVGPEGDEPHYLMVAASLLRDGDLALQDDYAEGRYRAFHPAPLEPHYRVRGREGEIYSLHAVGLSLLILPAYAVGGYAGGLLLHGPPRRSRWPAQVRELVRETLGEGADGVAWVDRPEPAAPALRRARLHGGPGRAGRDRRRCAMAAAPAVGRARLGRGAALASCRG